MPLLSAHDKLVRDVKEALRRLFKDQTVPEQVLRAELEEIVEDTQAAINTLRFDLYAEFDPEA